MTTIERDRDTLSAPPPEQLAQTPYHLRPQGTWTYADWLNFPDDGWTYEIINRELYMTPPPTINHQRSSLKLARKMADHAEENDLGEVLEAPCAVRLPTQAVPLEPDIFFIKKENLSIIEEKEVNGAPDLIVEILSPSNASYDRDKKFTVYQAAGVPEYWLVSYWQKTVELFSLTEGAYVLVDKYGMGETIASQQLAGFKIVVKTIFATVR